MKCKNCQYCEQRGSYQYFFCAKDNALIESKDYYGGKNMDCSMTNRLDDDDFTNNYMMWTIARK